VSVKNAPPGKPYPVANSVKLNAPFLSKEQRNLLQQQLVQFVADSLAVPTRSVLGFTQVVKPPVFDSASIDKSMLFMKGYLNSEGYYNVQFDTVLVKMDTLQRSSKFLGGQRSQRVEVTTEFRLTLGKPLTVDTVIYAFADSAMLQLALAHADKAVLRKGQQYSKPAIAAELDRLSAMLREYGYFRMGRGALLAEVDTTDPSLVSFDLDPIEQQLAAQRRKDNPSAKIRLLQRPGTDPAVFQRYYIDSVTIYPETRLSDQVDSLLLSDSGFVRLQNESGVSIVQRTGIYQEKMLRRTNYLLPGSLYADRYYYKTVNGFSQMGPWQQVDVRSATSFRNDSGRVSFALFLVPGKKQNFQVDLEGSQNNNISAANVLAGRFLAMGLALTHNNRNVWKRGTQSTTTARAGFELNNQTSSGTSGVFQSFIANVNQTFSLPRLIWPMHQLDTRALDNRKTLLNFGGTYTDRFQFFRQFTFATSIQWEWRNGKNGYSIAFPAFEVNRLRGDSLFREILANPSLIFAFSTGNIISTRATFDRRIDFKNSRHSGLFRTAAEVTLPGVSRWLSNKNVEFFQFVRWEGQYNHQVKLRRNAVNLRLYVGTGWDLSGNRQGTLPFFRQFVAGGSNSMRAWSVRQLGLGNSLLSDTNRIFTDRFGDVQLELNAEYRMRLARLFGYNLQGAAFTDIGNIWRRRPFQDGSGALELKYLYRDLAVAVGYGVRWDLSFLVIRLDAAFKVKDPVREGAGWLRTFEWKSTNRLGTNNRSNVALQFGIGYPF
jgi:outer membrane protein assembly factor BamA